MPPIATALRLGLTVAGGTDAHRVSSYNPFVALQWYLDGTTIGGVKTRGDAEAPSRRQALEMYTRNSAFMANDDDKRGTLEPGKFADLAVLSADYLTAPVGEIGKIRSLLTMVGGKVVYASDRSRRWKPERARSSRHCERKRSNPEAAKQDWIASSLALLAMTPRRRLINTTPAPPGGTPAADAGRACRPSASMIANALGVGERQPVGALLHQRGVDVHDRGQAHDVADLVAAQAIGISGAVEQFVMVQHHVQHFRRKAALGGERVIAAPRMLADLADFLVAERAGLSRIATGMNALPTSCSSAARVSRR